MFKRVCNVILFVFAVCAFCSINGHVSYARKVGNKSNAQAAQKKSSEEIDLPIKWKPNSELKKYNDNGDLKQIRKYGPDGRAIQDIDYEHGGSNHKFPHTHDWDWSMGDNNPKKKESVPLPGAKELPPKKNNKKNKNKKKMKKMNISKIAKKAATLGTVGTIAYFVISEGSRIVFPIRNLVPVL